MNAKKEVTIAISMQLALTHLGHSHVLVTLAILEMAYIVKVCSLMLVFLFNLRQNILLAHKVLFYNDNGRIFEW